MTQNEFYDWLRHHEAAFPLLSDWFKRVPYADKTKAHWYRALKSLSVDEAKSASDEMYANEELQPRGYQHHPARIRKIAYEASPRSAYESATGSSYVPVCALCGDSGYVSVWSEMTMKHVIEGRPFDWPWNEEKSRPKWNHECERDEIPVIRKSTVAVCTCLVGDRRRTQTRSVTACYDPNCMMLDSEPFEKLVEQAEHLMPCNEF